MKGLDRRRVLAGLAATGLLCTAASPAPGPLAVADRAELRRRFDHYLTLAASGDPAHRRYHAAGVATPGSPGSGRASVRTILVDDGGKTLAVEWHIDGTVPQNDVVFYHLSDGWIAEIRPARDGTRLTPADGHPLPARPPANTGPLPPTVHQPWMTPAKFRDYADLFSRFDERFVDYYTPDVRFIAKPATAPREGRKAILDLYRPLRAVLDEQLTVHTLVIDSDLDLMAAEVTNRLTARGAVRLPGRMLSVGDKMELNGVVVYGLKDGRIALIRDVGQ